mgnify:CR=1 FL=1
MPMLRLVLNQHERRALDVLAEREYRDATRQAALIVRRELERHGLLAIDEVSNEQ